MAQEAGYYIDVKTAYSSTTSKHNMDADQQAHFKLFSLIGSAFEHGVLEQLMGSDNPAVSTMKLFQIANAAGGKIFYADSTNFAAIRPQLQNYSVAELDSFQAQVSNGYTLILPDNGQLTLGQWKGKWYISKNFSATNMSMGMIIGGNYYGGYTGTPAVLSTPQVTQTITDNISSMVNPDTARLQLYSRNAPPPASKDPVDMASGSFFYDHTDLALGGNAPLGLGFTRSYDSGLSQADRGLGFGWTHNYDIRLTKTSHGDPGLGSRQAVDAAPFIAVLYASYDLLKTQDNITGWVVTSLTSKWAVDQVIDNAVTMHSGKQGMEFIKLPDGSYSPPPLVMSKLIDEGDGTFRLEERYGTVLHFNADDQVETLTDADGNSMVFSYSAGKLQSVRDAFSRTLTLQYSGEMINAVSDTSGRSVAYTYDADGDLVGHTDPENKLWEYGYDTSHRMTSLKNALGITTAVNTYDALGRVNTQTVPRQGGTSATYNFYFSGFRNVEEGQTGNTQTYYFDKKGRTIGAENALGNKITKEYDGQNHLVRVTDPRSSSITLVYDGNHNVSTITNALNEQTNNTYDAQFRLTDSADPLGHATHFAYDAEHHLTGTTDAEGNTTGATYNTNGLTNTATDGRGTLTTLTYDTYGHPQTTQTGSHPAITYTYDAAGRVTGLTDQEGATTQFAYDQRGLLLSKTDPLGKITSFTYDAAGRLLTKTDRNGQTVTYSYTPSGKPATITYPDTSTVGFTYDQLDHLVAMQDALGATGTTYDAAGRLTSVTDSHGFTVAYAYDEVGNLTALTYPGSKTVTYGYDALNRLATVTNWLGQTATYSYDPAGRLTKLANFNGLETDYAFDAADRLTDKIGNVASYHFLALDGNGNPTQTVQNEPIPLQLNPSSISHTYNPQKNRLLQAGVANFSYDNEGQLSTGYGASYTFDYEHRLTGVSGMMQYSYDGVGNRLQAVRDGIYTTRYIYDAAGNLLAEADGANNITRYYIHGLGLLAMVTPAEQAYCYHFNTIGSTIALTDQSQTVVNKYAYDPFGNNVNQVEAVPQPFKFVGQYGVMTEPNGFHYMRARYYDPQVGRFVSEDPLGFDSGVVNLYGYVGNNPVMLVDPWGLCGLTLSEAKRIDIGVRVVVHL